MAKIDVIIPVYNGEKFLDTVCRSFENQTFKDFRVIFVNDGSTDNTSLVLENLCKNASFETMIVSQENKGLPGARNAGIINATAEWIAFVDVDDYPLPEYLEYLYTAAVKTNVKLVYGNYYAQDAEKEHALHTAGENLVYNVMNTEETMREHYTVKWLAVCTLLLDRSWLVDNGLMFDEKCLLLEDNTFLMTVLPALEKACKIENNIYLYLTRKNSLLHTGDRKKYYAAFAGFDRVNKKINEMDTVTASTFRSIGPARFSLALIRRASKQLIYKEYREFTKIIPIKDYISQSNQLPLKVKVLLKLFVISPRLFYMLMNCI